MIVSLALAAVLRLNPSKIDSIDISWSWGGLGTPVHLKTHIERTDGAFVRSNGSVVAPEAIAAFTAAVDDMGSPVVPLAKIGITAAYMRSQMPSWRTSCIEGLPADSAPALAFDRKYTDIAAIESAYSAGLDRPTRALDTYPRLNVVVTTSSGSFTFSSQSVNAHMLPIDVSFPDGTRGQNLNWEFMPAIDGLLGGVPHNVRWYFGEMDREWIAGNWADAACDHRAVEAAKAAEHGPLLMALSKDAGLKISDFFVSGSWSARAGTARDERISVQLYGAHPTQSDYKRAIDLAARQLTFVKSVGWLMTALAQDPHGQIFIVGGGADEVFLPKMAEQSGRPVAAALLRAHRDDVIHVRLSTDGSRDWSSWYILPDRTMILTGYFYHMRGFPFGDRTYNAIAAPIGQTAAPSDDSPVFTALIVHPDGSIETAHP